MDIKFEVTPLHTTLSKDTPTTNYLLAKLSGEHTEKLVKQPLQIVIAIDCSSSMSGDIENAKRAACKLVEMLDATDSIGIVTFGNHSKIIHPLELLEDREAICNKINTIRVSGSTALFAGWDTSKELLIKSSLTGNKRIILLSDGEANIGPTKPDELSKFIKAATFAGIVTSTVGLGKFYNEDLLEAMANSGDGNYFYAENTSHIQGFFEVDLAGAKSSLGKATIRLKGVNGTDIKKVFKPNTLVNNEINIGEVITGVTKDTLIQIETFAQNAEGQQVVMELTAEIDGVLKASKTITIELELTDNEWVGVTHNQEVKERLALLEASEQREKALAELNNGDKAKCQKMLEEIKVNLETLPSSAFVTEELELLAHVQSNAEQQDYLRASKMSKSMTYASSNILARSALIKSYKATDEL